MSPRIKIPDRQIREFCRRWRIVELCLFGSVLREDFRPDSDVDVMVSFAPGSAWSLFDHIEMQEELGRILRRRVDLVTRKSVEASRNHIRRRAILDSAVAVHA